LAKRLVVEEELRRAGVKIDHVWGECPDTPEGRLNKHIRATVAEYEREKEAEPIRDRLVVVDDILSENSRQLEMLLDLCLSGDFTREVLTERKVRLETTIRSLEGERQVLLARLSAQQLTTSQIQTLNEFMAAARAGIDLGDNAFSVPRAGIEELNVRATLSVEDGNKEVKAECVVGERVFNLHPTELVLGDSATTLKGQATAENVNEVQAALYRIEVLHDAVKVKQSAGVKVHIWLTLAEVEDLVATCGNGIVGQRDRVVLGLLVEETAGYIKHHLRIAGYHDQLFSDSLVSGVYDHTKGVARKINNSAGNT
jgi:hypothetical protein